MVKIDRQRVEKIAEGLKGIPKQHRNNPIIQDLKWLVALMQEIVSERDKKKK